MVHVVDKGPHALRIFHILGHTEDDVSIDLMVAIRSIWTSFLRWSKIELNEQLNKQIK